MANNTLHQCLFLSLLLCTASTVLSRTLVENPESSYFDLSASAQKMHDFLSFNPENQREDQFLGKSDDSSLTLKLFPRDTLRKSPFKTFEELVLSRFERDSARVSYIYSKLNGAVNERNDSEFVQSEIEAPVTSGARQGIGNYFARLGVGTPARMFYMVIDTGSDINWIQCASCTQCFNQTDPLFDPSGSSSYRPLSCDSPSCRALDPYYGGCRGANTCTYTAQYADRAFSDGDFATERLTFGHSVVDNIAIGCGVNNSGFVGQAGILGLGLGALSLPSQLRTQSFSYCLVDIYSTSASTLDFSPVAIPSNAIRAPLLRNSQRPSFYYVGLTGISVGGQMLPISPSEFSINPDGDGGVIVDSGTTISQIPASIYNVFRDAFVSGVTELPRRGSFSVYDTCFEVGSQTGASVPTVAFHFGTQSLTLPSNNYLLRVRQDLLCFAFAASPLSSVIIGNIQQQGFQVTFDVGRSLIGFTPNQC